MGRYNNRSCPVRGDPTPSLVTRFRFAADIPRTHNVDTICPNGHARWYADVHLCIIFINVIAINNSIIYKNYYNNCNYIQSCFTCDLHTIVLIYRGTHI